MHDGKDLGRRNRASVEPVAQRLAAHELEDDVIRLGRKLDIVNLNKVGMARPRHHLGLLQKALEGDGIGRGRLDQLLDRHLAPETRLLGEVYRAHSAAAELAFDAIFADEPLARHRRWSGDHHRDRRRRSRRRRHGDQPHRRRDIRNVRNRGGRRPDRCWRGWRRRVGRAFGGRVWRLRGPRRNAWRQRVGRCSLGLTGIGHSLASLAECIEGQITLGDQWSGYSVFASFDP